MNAARTTTPLPSPEPPPGVSLRERHAAQTRELIFRAVAEQLAGEGFQDFNIPRLARRAGVSVRTVYRYFPTREALLDAAAVWFDEQIAVLPAAATAADLEGVSERLFPAFDENETLLLAQWATAAGRAIRDRARARRLGVYREALRDVTSGLGVEEERAALAVIAYLLSSWTWKTMKEEFGMDGSESGRAVAWAIRTLVADLRSRNPISSSGKGQV